MKNNISKGSQGTQGDNLLKKYILAGVLFVIIFGSLAHFFYDWSGKNPIVGLFTPVNESTWEHMKLVFFPMLLFAFVAIPRLEAKSPCIREAFLWGIIAGTFLIPVIFYTYTGILGGNWFVLDIATFVVSVLLAFGLVYLVATHTGTRNNRLLNIVVCLLTVCFWVFTIWPPDISLFTSP